jgi:hypothetical protein
VLSLLSIARRIAQNPIPVDSSYHFATTKINCLGTLLFPGHLGKLGGQGKERRMDQHEGETKKGNGNCKKHGLRAIEK